MAASWPPVAGNESQNKDAAIQPFAGEAPIITDSAPALAAIAYLQVIAITATGVTPYVDATHDERQIAVAAAGAAISEQCPYYTNGKFNHEALTWPAEYDTFAKRKAFVAGSGISIGHLSNNDSVA